jgi:hypothetical protein
MGKSVNASFTITRDGIATVKNLPGLSYGKLVALEVAFTGALTSLCTWGVNAMADAMTGTVSPASGLPKNSDITLQLQSDHGPGSSSFQVSYTGLSAKDADEIAAVAKAAYDSVM